MITICSKTHSQWNLNKTENALIKVFSNIRNSVNGPNNIKIQTFVFVRQQTGWQILHSNYFCTKKEINRDVTFGLATWGCAYCTALNINYIRNLVGKSNVLEMIVERWKYGWLFIHFAVCAKIICLQARRGGGKGMGVQRKVEREFLKHLWTAWVDNKPYCPF